MRDDAVWPLRIALLTHSVNPRGGVVHVLELARALHTMGHLPTVLAPAMAGQRMFREVPHALALVPAGPAPTQLVDLVGQRIGEFKSHLVEMLAKQAFDVFHAHDGIGGNALADLADAGVIDGFMRTVHHLDPFDDARLAHWQARSVRGASQVLCVSRMWRDALRRDFGIDAWQVANGVDLARFTPRGDGRDKPLAARLGLRPGAPLFLCVGGIEARKNTLRILEAYAAIHAQQPRAQLVIAGGASLLDHSAYAADCHALIAQHALKVGPGRSVVLTGALADDDMPALFRLADALVMPSLREGFGLVVLESLASGTPVVASGIPPFTEYLDDTVAAGHAVYADPQDTDSVAAAMRRAAEPERAARLALATPEVCLRHAWPHSAARHVALYRAHRALQARPAPAAAAH